MLEKIKIIKEFAEKMGYEVNEIITSGLGIRSTYTIELIDTCDSLGYPYVWKFDVWTGEEIKG